MSGHVPGPWEICKDPPNPYWKEGVTIGAGNDKDARRICDVFTMALLPSEMSPVHKANARLIAAAPDLLLACQMIEGSRSAWDWLSENDGLALQQLLSAIAKATQP